MWTGERVTGSIDAFARSIRYATRGLVKSPAFTATVVLTLALAIGANSTVFSAINAVILRPLPYPNADRLMRVRQVQQGQNVNVANVAPVRLEEWNELNSTFEALTGYYTEDVSDTSGNLPERIRRANVAPRFVDVWGIAPALGRGFALADHEAGAARVAMISDRYWRRRFNADPGVLDTAVRIGSGTFTLIGVMPVGFTLGDSDVDVWVALTYEPFVLNRGSAWLTAFGRLRPGVSVDQARADLAVVQAGLAERFPDTDGELMPEVEPYKNTVVGGVSGSLWLLFGAVSVLLLIACTNIAALLLARATQRRQEDAVRLALGASSWSIAARTLAETAVLAGAGAALGLAVAVGAAAALRAVAPGFPRVDEIVVDLPIVLYTLVSIVAVTLIGGLVPAVRSARGAASGGNIAESGRGHVSGGHSLQWSFVGVQVALSIMLLAGAGLLVRSFEALGRVDPGFDPEGVLSFRISGSYGEPFETVRQGIEVMLTEIASLPGVEAAATSSPVPGVLSDQSGFQFGTIEFEFAGGVAETDSKMSAEFRVVSPSYFDTMHIPLLAGEPCRRDELVVNQALADRYLAGRSPVGRELVMANGNALRIVGLVGSAREFGLDRAPVPVAYGCTTVVVYPPLAFLVRTRGDPLALAGTVRQRLKDIEPQRSVYDVLPLTERMGAEYAADRLRTALIALFAGAALALVCLGVYGTLSYIVSLRRREVGLRIALGARSSNIVAQFVLRALNVVAIACVAGLALAFAFSQTLSGMLFGVSPWDPLTLAGVLAIVVGVALAAALLPATRAARIEPMEALREE